MEITEIKKSKEIFRQMVEENDKIHSNNEEDALKLYLKHEKALSYARQNGILQSLEQEYERVERLSSVTMLKYFSNPVKVAWERLEKLAFLQNLEVNSKRAENSFYAAWSLCLLKARVEAKHLQYLRRAYELLQEKVPKLKSKQVGQDVEREYTENMNRDKQKGLEAVAKFSNDDGTDDFLRGKVLYYDRATKQFSVADGTKTEK